MDLALTKSHSRLCPSILLCFFCLFSSLQIIGAQDGKNPVQDGKNPVQGGKNPVHTATVDQGESSLGGTIFHDANKNGVMDQGEAPAAGIEVSLLGKDSEVIATVFTDQFGRYLFTGLEPGVYVLRFAFTPDFVVRSTGITVGYGKSVGFTVPVITPDSRYNFIRLRLVNPATVKTSAPVTPSRP